MEAVIGFDTSCYTTSVGIVSADGCVLGSFRQLLTVDKGERGLRQSDGVFQHVRQIAGLVTNAFAALPDMQLIAVGVSSSPRDETDSYMPVFMVGDAHGCAIAAAMGIPVFHFSHQRGHIRAAMVDSGLTSKRFLALHLSGGTTEMVVFENDTIILLGGTKDLHAGQLVDRVGVALGLNFPAGRELEQMAMRGATQAKLPTAMADRGLTCHLSGAETKAMQWIAAGEKPEDIACEVFDFLARTIAKMILAGAKEKGINDVLIAGGVASSQLLRDMLTKRMQKLSSSIKLYFGKAEYSGDNAVGTALLALDTFRKGNENGSTVD